MLSVMIVILGALITAARYPDLPISRLFHSALIAAPAAWLTRTPPQRIAILLILAIGMIMAWEELVPLLIAADYSPLLWLADMSIYLDVLLAVTVAATAIRVRTLARLTTVVLPRVRTSHFSFRGARERSHKTRRMRRPQPADEDAPGFAVVMSA